MMWDGNGYFGHGGGEGWVMFLFMIVFLVAAVIAVIFLVRYLAQPQGGSQASQATPATPPRETPRDILQRRYAAGEIDREEYLQKLGDL